MSSVTFWSQDNYSGKTKSFVDVGQVPDFNQVQWSGKSHDDMKDDASSMQTGDNSWVRIYSKANYQGRTALVGPNTSVTLKNLKSDDGSDDMDDTVESFQMWNHKPSVDTTAIIKNFDALFPGTYGRKDNLYNTEIHFQDSDYRIYDPELVLDGSGNTLAFTINLDHIQTEFDDHAVLTFAMDLYGGFAQQIQVTYDLASAAQVPDWAIKVTDGLIDAAELAAKAIADGAEIVLTDGVGVVATVETDKLISYTADALTFCVDHLNTVLALVFTFQDDGGTSYFPAVVSHTIVRAIHAYYEELLGKRTDDMVFDDSAFLSAFGATAYGGDKHTGFIEFAQGQHSCRAYQPDRSALYAHGGIVTSVKVDAVTNNQKDDHLILQVVTDPHGNLFAVAASMDIFDRKAPSDYQSPTTGLLTYDENGQMVRITQDKTRTPISYASLKDAYVDLMNQALDATESDYGTNITDQQRELVDGGGRVLDAIHAAT